jgi:hypothetical protein
MKTNDSKIKKAGPRKTEADKPRRYPSVPRLAAAWLKEEIRGEAFASTRGGFMIVADSETIWNGYKSQVLVRRNRTLGLVMALRESAASLGKAAITVMNLALVMPGQTTMRRTSMGHFKDVVKPAHAPYPYFRIDSLADPSLSHCHVETLRPHVLESATKVLEFKLWWYNRYPKHSLQGLENLWNEEKMMLANVGLSVPPELEEKYTVMKATRRLLDK